MKFQSGSPEETVYMALSETFENLVFEEVVVDSISENKWPCIEKDAWWAKIELFPPPIDGEIILIVPNTLMGRFTEATLGLENEPPSAEEKADDLGELLNTLSGRMMAMRVNPNQIYKMGLPESGRGDKAPTKNSEHKLLDCLIGDDHIYLMVPVGFWNF